jgi:CspA family cold shock protein
MSNQGTIKWFSNAKGFGFILPDNGEGDIFVHYSAINVEGYKTLKAGQNVSYDTVRGEKGIHAANIQPFDEYADAEDANTKNSDIDMGEAVAG